VWGLVVTRILITVHSLTRWTAQKRTRLVAGESASACTSPIHLTKACDTAAPPLALSALIPFYGVFCVISVTVIPTSLSPF
jgi:hypothetical protein